MHYTYTILTYYIICVSIELENKYSSSRTVGMFLLEFHPEVSNPNWWISINCQTLHIFYTFYFKLHFEGLFIQENRTSNSNIGWRYQQKYYANNVFIKYYLSPGSPQSAEEDMAAEEKYTEGVVCGGLGDYREHPAGFQ